MGLAKRITPTLLCRGRQLIKGRAFASWRSVGVAAQAVRVHQARGVDELVLVKSCAVPAGAPPAALSAARIVDRAFPAYAGQCAQAGIACRVLNRAEIDHALA